MSDEVIVQTAKFETTLFPFHVVCARSNKVGAFFGVFFLSSFRV